MRSEMNAAAFADRYDALLMEPRTRALYGESGYFNVGYWVDGARDLVAACNRMVDEFASKLSGGIVLDVGCGLGAGTRRLAESFPGSVVAGVNISHWQLTQARARGVSAAVVADATMLPFGTGAVDAVVAIESAEHFDTRETFFAEAYRVLRPGGIIALTDMLFHEGDSISDRMLLPRQRVSTIEEYESALRQTGFTGVTVRDITAQTWTPYCAEMRRVFQGHEDALQRIEESLAHYVFAFAQRV
jgi:ubiquinone/menaquinone biosynthesis C-methylase UbiE